MFEDSVIENVPRFQITITGTAQASRFACLSESKARASTTKTKQSGVELRLTHFNTASLGVLLYFVRQDQLLPSREPVSVTMTGA